MKQNMKRALLILCMAVCFFTLSACAKKADVTEEPIPPAIMEMMSGGADNYLLAFDSFDDEKLAEQLKLAEKKKDNVMITAITSWKTVKGDLGKMTDGSGAILSKDIVRVSEDSYRIDVRVRYEKREMEFTLSAEEVMSKDNSGGSRLEPTELIFAPVYTTGEKLSKAAQNTAMGFGTVFAVLIFISLIIASLKGVNTLEKKFKAKKEAKEKEAAASAMAAEPSVQAPVHVPAPALEIPAPAAVLPQAPAPVYAEEFYEEDLVDDRELAAVIMAAIAAAQSVPVEGLVVRSIRRKPTASKWKNA